MLFGTGAVQTTLKVSYFNNEVSFSMKIGIKNKNIMINGKKTASIFRENKKKTASGTAQNIVRRRKLAQ